MISTKSLAGEYLFGPQATKICNFAEEGLTWQNCPQQSIIDEYTSVRHMITTILESFSQDESFLTGLLQR